MFKKVLVANRGEIAVRIIRALRELGITSVAVYSEADREALHTELADEAICIGPDRALDSYANEVAIISAALLTGAEAIHPGYGFLSENNQFITLCEELGIKFIGPSSNVVMNMGNKHNARGSMDRIGIPIIPGSTSIVKTLADAQEIADEIGYPLMIKASDGGGGTGMRQVESENMLATQFHQAQTETQSVYGNKNLYIERIIQPAKHIEVQILADQHGNVIHLGERDCSLQRNHQKIIEIAPAFSLEPSLRQRISADAVKAAKAIGYQNAGTFEFLVDADNNYYFMEMNTRLQVEHPITEMVTGVDIVKEQIRIAAGLELSYEQSDIEFNGIAIEARLNAEDPKYDFRPQAGKIETLMLPSGGLGLRVETALYPNYLMPPFYDSMIAKIIVHSSTSQEAFSMMRRALYEVTVEGIETNIDLLEDLISDEAVINNQVDTQWIEKSFMTQWLMDNQMTQLG